MPPRPLTQSLLFDDTDTEPLPQLPQDVQIQLPQQVVQWLQALALAIYEGPRDEQDHR